MLSHHSSFFFFCFSSVFCKTIYQEDSCPLKAGVALNITKLLWSQPPPRPAWRALSRLGGLISYSPRLPPQGATGLSLQRSFPCQTFLLSERTFSPLGKQFPPTQSGQGCLSLFLLPACSEPTPTPEASVCSINSFVKPERLGSEGAQGSWRGCSFPSL